MTPIVLHIASALGELLLAPVKLLADFAAYIFIKPAVSHSTGLVLITGASRGIGRAIAVSLGKAGYTVIAGVRKEDDGLALVRDFPGVLQHYVLLDVAESKSIAEARVKVEEIGRTTGLPLVGLVNNAGVSACEALELASNEVIDNIVNVNYKGPIRMIQTFLPLLRESRGRIINISSVLATLPLPFGSFYEGTKAALDQTSRALRMEVWNQGVSVISVRAGPTDTDMATAEARIPPPHRHDVNDDQLRLYGARMEKFRTTRTKNITSPLDLAENVVKHAMMSTRPLPVYYYGLDSVMYSLIAQILPETFNARLAAKVI